MGPSTKWEIFVSWLLTPWVWTQCKDLNDDGFYCRRRCWHHGPHKYHETF